MNNKNDDTDKYKIEDGAENHNKEYNIDAKFSL